MVVLGDWKSRLYSSKTQVRVSLEAGQRKAPLLFPYPEWSLRRHCFEADERESFFPIQENWSYKGENGLESSKGLALGGTVEGSSPR